MYEWGEVCCEENNKDFNKAMNYFETNCKRWGRLWFLTKEKYGTMRINYFYPSSRLDYLCGYNVVTIRHPKVYKWCKKINVFTQYVGFNWLVWQWQKFIFNLVSIQLYRKWPHLKAKLFNKVDFNDLLYDWVKNFIQYKDR